MGRLTLKVKGIKIQGNLLSVRARKLFLYPGLNGKPRASFTAGLYGVVPLASPSVGVGKGSLVDRLTD